MLPSVREHSSTKESCVDRDEKALESVSLWHGDFEYKCPQHSRDKRRSNHGRNFLMGPTRCRKYCLVAANPQWQEIGGELKKNTKKWRIFMKEIFSKDTMNEKISSTLTPGQLWSCARMVKTSSGRRIGSALPNNPRPVRGRK